MLRDREDFAPRVWREEPAPEHAVNCMACELAGQRSRVIWGEGNPKAPILVLLDNPGDREDREGNAFVCGTRQALQQAAYETGLSEEDLYVTYLLKCRPKRAYDKELARSACSGHLTAQLALQRPKLLFCLGNVVVQSFFGNPEAEVKNLRGRVHQVEGWAVVVSYHPLAVRRRPNLLRLFLEDWRLLAETLHGL
ncbi:uracil-DNA glycosylase [Paenibacillus silviterrae]|uniref:uracil-DNA glycosylase n=1 Tax=Paenibacillus silviterrae TaxID=3242194 RepID=UPI002542C37A|nr:uracil-DNA glycosylase [Paenibacillus chinjuensis]